MKLLKRVCFLLVLLLFSAATNAQESLPNANPNDFMNQNGKIFVVLAVVVVIVTGLFLYLYALDKKISKWEKNDHIN